MSGPPPAGATGTPAVRYASVCGPTTAARRCAILLTLGGAVLDSLPTFQRTLRILSLNLWAGTVIQPLLAFLREQAPYTDIFCLQEVLDAPERAQTPTGFRTTLLAELVQALPEFESYFSL